MLDVARQTIPTSCKCDGEWDGKENGIWDGRRPKGKDEAAKEGALPKVYQSHSAPF